MTDECITIESSDEDDIQIMEALDPEVVPQSLQDGKKTIPSETIETGKSQFTAIKETPSTQVDPGSSQADKKRVLLQTIETGKSQFAALLSMCKKADPSSEMDIVVNKMWKRFHQADSLYTSSASFIDLVKWLMKGAATEPYQRLKVISDNLKFNTVKSKARPVESEEPSIAASGSNQDESNDKTRRMIKKLEKVLAKLQMKIYYLENQEVDLNNSSDDENSAYIQVCRYKNRICDVFKKLCELRKTDTFDECLRSNIKFSGTKIAAVNRAIEKFYNETRKFPDFRDVLTIVEKANEIKNLRLTPYECYEIAVQAFKELGETLKRQRQFDFHESLTSFVGNNGRDPAAEDHLLKSKLEENKKLYGNRIDEIIDKYAKKQVDDKLESEIVPDDAMSEMSESGIEEEEEEDDYETASSITERNSNDNVSSADEDSVNGDEDDANHVKDNENSDEFEARDLRVVLPNLLETPEWSQYQQHNSLHCCKGPICEPIPGCSKDVVDDFCELCSPDEPNSSVTKRKHVLTSDDSDDSDEMKSCSKVMKSLTSEPLLSVDLTAETRVTEASAKPTDWLESPVKEATKSAAIYPLSGEKTSCFDATKGNEEESPKNSDVKSASPTPFVIVDVDSILSKGALKPKQLTMSKTENNATRVQVFSPIDDIENVTCDENVPSSCTNKDIFNLNSKNGIKIVNVISKKDSSSAVVANEKLVNHVEDKAGDFAKNKLTTSNTTTNSQVIDLEKSAPRSTTVNSKLSQIVHASKPKNFTNLLPKKVSSSTIQHSKPLCFRSNSYQKLRKPEDKTPWQKCMNSLGKNKYPVSSTPKPNTVHQNVFPPPPPIGSRMPTYGGVVNGPASKLPRISAYSGSCTRGAVPQQLHFDRPLMPKSHPSPAGMPVGPRGIPAGPRGPQLGPRTAMAKRTMQTTQKFVKGNSIYTQTMTVVQESMVQLPPPAGPNMARNSFGSNGRSNHRFGGAATGGAGSSRGFTSNYSAGVCNNVCDPRLSVTKSNSTNDVITLD